MVESPHSQTKPSLYKDKEPKNKNQRSMPVLTSRNPTALLLLMGS